MKVTVNLAVRRESPEEFPPSQTAVEIAAAIARDYGLDVVTTMESEDRFDVELVSLHAVAA